MTVSEPIQIPASRVQFETGSRLYTRTIKPVAMKAKKTDPIASPLLGRSSNTLPLITWTSDAKKITETTAYPVHVLEHSVEPVKGCREKPVFSINQRS